MSGEANPSSPDFFGRIRWRGNKPHERHAPNAARFAALALAPDTARPRRSESVAGAESWLESLRRTPRSRLVSSLLLKGDGRKPQGSKKNEGDGTNQYVPRRHSKPTKTRQSA